MSGVVSNDLDCSQHDSQLGQHAQVPVAGTQPLSAPRSVKYLVAGQRAPLAASQNKDAPVPASRRSYITVNLWPTTGGTGDEMTDQNRLRSGATRFEQYGPVVSMTPGRDRAQPPLEGRWG